MKKVVGIISLALCAMFVQSSEAADEKVIAILDTAIDSSKFSNIIYEACFTGNATCPNNSNFQEGKGAANVSNWDATGMGHGYNIVYSAVKTSPTVKIVFVRISNLAPGTTQMAYNEGQSLSKAIEWVSKNASKYSIDAVSISQSRSNFTVGTCPSDAVFESAVNSLNKINVSTFVATGNDSLKNSIGFPSCVAGVIPVGALDPLGNVASFSNNSSKVRLFANGCLEYKGNTCVKTPDYAGVMRATSGTSVATPIAVAKLVSKWNGENWTTFLGSLPTNKL